MVECNCHFLDTNMVLALILPNDGSKSESAKYFILDKGTNLKYGARPLRRAIQKYIEDPISDMILKSEVHSFQTIYVYLEDDILKFNIS